jgi:general stress protein CsbA
MGCKCNWVESVLAIVIIVFAWMQGVSGTNMWIIVVAAVLLLLHALMCKKCKSCETPMGSVGKTSPARRKKRRR